MGSFTMFYNVLISFFERGHMFIMDLSNLEPLALKLCDQPQSFLNFSIIFIDVNGTTQMHKVRHVLKYLSKLGPKCVKSTYFFHLHLIWKLAEIILLQLSQIFTSWMTASMKKSAQKWNFSKVLSMWNSGVKIKALI